MQIKRDLYLKKLVERMNNGMVKIVTGIRRSGKSYLLNVLFVDYLLENGVDNDHIIRVSMEGFENIKYRSPEYTYQFIKDRLTDDDTHYIIIDEVQMMDNFIEVLNGLMILKNTDVYVTGSNSRFLSSDIATEFRGRGDIIQMHPLRFAEMMTVYNDRDEAWDDYVNYGGMPLVFSYQSKAGKEQYLTELFNTAFVKDVIERNGLKNEQNLAELLDVLASGIGSLTNPTKLENTFKSEKKVVFSHQTINAYIGYLKDAFLISKAQRYDVKGKRYINSPYKIYFEDIGLRNARLNFRQIEEGHILENIIYNELIVRGYRVDVGVVEFFKKDENGKTMRIDYEVDFIVNRGSERFYIQSAYEIPGVEKEIQEKNSLRSINDSFKKIIITKGYMKPRIDDEGIITIGVINFLLDDSILS